MPNYEDFKRYGEIEKQKAGDGSRPRPGEQPRKSWIGRTIAALRSDRPK